MRMISVYSDNSLAKRVLWSLLVERTAEESISHSVMPTWEKHCSFVDGFPYLGWWIMEINERMCPEYVGAIYLTHMREVGIFVFKSRRGLGYGLSALAELRKKFPGPLLANVNPDNAKSRAFFEKLGAKQIQVTYKL